MIKNDLELDIYRNIFPKEEHVYLKELDKSVIKILELAYSINIELIYISIETVHELIKGKSNFFAKMSVFKSMPDLNTFGFNTTVTEYKINKTLKVSEIIKHRKIYECGPKNLCISIIKLGKNFNSYLNKHVNSLYRSLYIGSKKESTRLLEIRGYDE